MKWQRFAHTRHSRGGMRFPRNGGICFLRKSGRSGLRVCMFWQTAIPQKTICSGRNSFRAGCGRRARMRLPPESSLPKRSGCSRRSCPDGDRPERNPRLRRCRKSTNSKIRVSCQKMSDSLSLLIASGFRCAEIISRFSGERRFRRACR